MDHSYHKTVWLEGMFLSPQHFQQQERYLEHYSQQICEMFAPGSAGFASLVIDPEHLKVGKVFLREAKGIFPGGTPFDSHGVLCRNMTHITPGDRLYLALPLIRSGTVDTVAEDSTINLKTVRYVSSEQTVYDCTNADNEPVEMVLSTLNPCILTEGEALDEYTTLTIARIQECHQDGELVLDHSFIPRCLDYRASKYLEDQVLNLKVMMQQRAAVIAAQIGVEGEQKSFQTMQIAYMWLQALNRYTALLKHITRQKGISASQLYRELSVMAAELATFTTTLAPEFPVFDEGAVYESFAPVITSLLLNLRQASKEKVVAIEWDDRLYKKRRLLRVQIVDRTLFNDGRFIITVSSSLGQEKTKVAFLGAAKLCGQNRIVERVRNATSAVPMTSLAAPPYELKVKSNTAYFEIDTSDKLWQELIKTQDAIALHVDQQMPDDTIIHLFVIR